MTILVYRGKYGREYWLANTDEQLSAALTKLFKRLDEWSCYEDDEDGIAEARAGNFKAIRSILVRHSDYEYEGWDLEEAIDPCTD